MTNKKDKTAWKKVTRDEFLVFFNQKIANERVMREDSFEREETVFWLKNADGTKGEIVGRVEGFKTDEEGRKFFINEIVEKRYVN
jgi:hypothetical protein